MDRELVDRVKQDVLIYQHNAIEAEAEERRIEAGYVANLIASNYVKLKAFLHDEDDPETLLETIDDAFSEAEDVAVPAGMAIHYKVDGTPRPNTIAVHLGWIQFEKFGKESYIPRLTSEGLAAINGYRAIQGLESVDETKQGLQKKMLGSGGTEI